MVDPISLREQEILEKITLAKKAAQDRQRHERQLEREKLRESKISTYSDQVKTRLIALQNQLENSLMECAILGQDDPLFQELQQQLATIATQISDPRPLAEVLYQEEIEHEELQIIKREWEESVAAEERRIEESLVRWRQGLVHDILHTIDEATTYFEASDIAVYLRDYREDLQAIGQLEPVLIRLISRINTLNTRGNPFELRYPIETTLNRMVDFALNQRLQRTNVLTTGRSTGNASAVTTGSITELRQVHRQESDRPYEYRGLTGKVVVYGGHPRMHRNVVRRMANIKFIWFDLDDGITSMADRTEVARDADLVILITAYTSHKVQRIAQTACETYGIPLTYHNSTGIRSMIDLIAVELQKKKLAAKVP